MEPDLANAALPDHFMQHQSHSTCADLGGKKRQLGLDNVERARGFNVLIRNNKLSNVNICEGR